MKNYAKKLSAIIAASAAFALAGCAQPITVVFESDRPWHSGELSFEKLGYSVGVYDTTAGTEDDKRVLIADGELVYTLNEKAPDASNIAYTTLDMQMRVTYNDRAPDADKGKTDKISSTTEFQTASLVASTVAKTVELDNRDGVRNNSYTLNADYFGEKKATINFTSANVTDKLDIPTGSYYDNETMYYLARATGIELNSNTNFVMVSLFDSFLSDKFDDFNMVASSKADPATVVLGEFAGSFGVEAATADDGTTYYPVSCLETSIIKNEKLSGPPHYVYYSEKPFTQNGKEHAKIPVKMSYSEYKGNTVVRVTEYILTSCSFERE